MASNHDGGAGTVFMAFTLGALSGAVFALLLAPTTGDETRRYLEDRAREGADKAGDTARQVGERVREGRTRAADALKQGREYVERQRETLASAVDHGKEAYDEALEKEPV